LETTDEASHRIGDRQSAGGPAPCGPAVWGRGECGRCLRRHVADALEWAAAHGRPWSSRGRLRRVGVDLRPGPRDAPSLAPCRIATTTPPHPCTPHPGPATSRRRCPALRCRGSGAATGRLRRRRRPRRDRSGGAGTRRAPRPRVDRSAV